MTSLRSEVGGVIEASWRPLRREDWPSRVMMLSLPGLIMILYKEPILIITSQGYLSPLSKLLLTSEVSSISFNQSVLFWYFVYSSHLKSLQTLINSVFRTIIPSWLVMSLAWRKESWYRLLQHVLQLLRNGVERWHKYQIIHSINICNCHRIVRQLFSHPVTEQAL